MEQRPDAIQAIIEMKNRIEGIPLSLEGRLLYPNVPLSPTGLSQTPSVNTLPHAEFVFELAAKGPRRPLVEPLRAKDKYGNQEWDMGIYTGNPMFPDRCCVCFQEPDHYEVAQTYIPKVPWKIGIQGHDREKISRIFDAIGGDRYWHALPFCEKHGLASRSIEIRSYSVGYGNVYVALTNRQFAEEFARLNQLEGKWDTNALGWTRALGGVLLWIGIVTSIIMGFGMWILFSGDIGHANKLSFATQNPGIMVLIFIVGLSIVGGGIYCKIKGSRYELISP